MYSAPSVPSELASKPQDYPLAFDAPHSLAQPKPIVMKFGGTSVADSRQIRSVAHRVLNAQCRGQSPVVVVSAAAGETDRLLALAKHLALELGVADDHLDRAEIDVLAATGE